MAVDCWQLTFDRWLSTIDYQPLLLNVDLTVDCWLLTVDCWLLTVDCWLLTVDCWLLTVDCMFIINYWLLTQWPLTVDSLVSTIDCQPLLVTVDCQPRLLNIDSYLLSTVDFWRLCIDCWLLTQWPLTFDRWLLTVNHCWLLIVFRWMKRRFVPLDSVYRLTVSSRPLASAAHSIQLFVR